MPFITEEIYQFIDERKGKDSIMISSMPTAIVFDNIIITRFEEAKQIITAIRNIRQEKNLAQKDILRLMIKAKESIYSADFLPVIKRLANIDQISFIDFAEDGAITFLVNTSEYSIPLGNLIDVEAEKTKLHEELKYHEGFLNSVLIKLSNEKFVNHAPKNVVDIERKKQADAEMKINALKEQLKKLSN